MSEYPVTKKRKELRQRNKNNKKILNFEANHTPKVKDFDVKPPAPKLTEQKDIVIDPKKYALMLAMCCSNDSTVNSTNSA